MKPTILLILTLTGLMAVLAAGCASSPTTKGGGAIGARSFSFVTSGAKPSPGYADDRQAAHALIQSAITQHLDARGVNRADTGGDVVVGYLIITGNNASTASINEFFGYSEDASALHEKAHRAYSRQKTQNYFEAGTLVIDVRDPLTGELLSRGHASRPLLRDVTTEQRAANIQAVVDEILRGVRFKS